MLYFVVLSCRKLLSDVIMLYYFKEDCTVSMRLFPMFRSDALSRMARGRSQMAKDEARHGAAFAGLLKRYFG